MRSRKSRQSALKPGFYYFFDYFLALYFKVDSKDITFSASGFFETYQKKACFQIAFFVCQLCCFGVPNSIAYIVFSAYTDQA